MTRPEPEVTLPPAAQGTGLGEEKKFSDLSDNLEVSMVDGEREYTAKLSGDLKKIDSWPEYSRTENGGHFFYFQLPEGCLNKDITFKGRTSGDRQVHIASADDLIVIVRYENLTSEAKLIVEMDGETLLVVDVSAVKCLPYVGRDAVRIPELTEDMDAAHAGDLIEDNVKIAWSGTTGTVTGTVKKYKMTGDHFSNKEGYFLPVVIMGHNGQEITVTGGHDNTAKKVDTKWIIDVETNKGESKIKFEDGDLVLCELDINSLEMQGSTPIRTKTRVTKKPAKE